MKRFVFVILMFCAMWLTISCHSSSQLISQTDCYKVEHTAGIACVPKTINRLVTLDSASFENAIALGLTPVGTVLAEQSTPYLQQQSIVNVGQSGNPSLEAVLALKPDLIVGLSYHNSIYAQLSQIAPTVLLELEHSGKWKEYFRDFGRILNRTAIAQQVIQQYDRRVQEFKTQLSATPPKISVVRVYPDSMSLYLQDSFSGVILKDAGLDRPKSQSLSASEGQRLFGNPIQAIVSVEQIEQADGDMMFVWTSENTLASTETAQKKLEELRSSDLWSKLQAVQNDHTYLVPNYWIGSSPLAANAVIGDLFKYVH